MRFQGDLTNCPKEQTRVFFPVLSLCFYVHYVLFSNTEEKTKQPKGEGRKYFRVAFITFVGPRCENTRKVSHLASFK